MKAEKFLDPIGGISDAYLEESEITAPAKVYPWIKWMAVAACVLVAALIAIPAILNSKAQAENVPDTSLPAEAVITDDAREGIKKVLTRKYYELIDEDEFGNVTVGLPIAMYGLYLDDTGEYCWYVSEYSQMYPIYVDGEFEYLVGTDPRGYWIWSEPYLVSHINFDGNEPYFDEPLHEEVLPRDQVLFDRLQAGSAGTVAMVSAADGTYLFDGSTFERVYEIGNGVDEYYDAQFDEDGNYTLDWPESSVEPPQKLTPANLDGADLPAELIDEIRLTDTSVTEPLI